MINVYDAGGIIESEKTSVWFFNSRHICLSTIQHKKEDTTTSLSHCFRVKNLTLELGKGMTYEIFLNVRLAAQVATGNKYDTCIMSPVSYQQLILDLGTHDDPTVLDGVRLFVTNTQI